MEWSSPGVSRDVPGALKRILGGRIFGNSCRSASDHAFQGDSQEIPGPVLRPALGEVGAHPPPVHAEHRGRGDRGVRPPPQLQRGISSDFDQRPQGLYSRLLVLWDAEMLYKGRAAMPRKQLNVTLTPEQYEAVQAAAALDGGEGGHLLQRGHPGPGDA